MKNEARQELSQIRDQLNSLKYDTKILEDRDKTTLSAEGESFFKIEYSEEGERNGYSLYDINLIVDLDGQSFIYILSERMKESFRVDFEKVRGILKSINNKSYNVVEESSMIFWKRKYLKIEHKGEVLYLLKIK